MENLIDIFSRCEKGNPTTHGTLTSLFVGKLNDQQIIKRKNYFSVSDICNPLQAYFKYKYPDKFEQSIETKKRFSLGNKRHNIIQKKIEKVDGFVDKEVILDGELLGILLKGRADAKIKKSFWEIKSKPELPTDKEQILKDYPQDIEQLCFYPLLDPEKPLENYLIFTTHLDYDKFKVFKIKILDFGKIKSLALKRISDLTNWLDVEPPINPMKCRYCFENCSLKDKECKFFNNQVLPCEVENYVEIEESPEIEEILKNTNLTEFEKEFSYPIYNLIIPRKIINEGNVEVEEEDEEYDNSFKKLNSQLIQDLIYKLGYNISFEEFKSLEETKRIKEISQNKNSFIKIISNQKEVIFPILIHISKSFSSDYLNKVSPYKIGELGVHCFNNKSTKGYIISFFPKQNNELRIFEVNYDFPNEISQPLKKVVEILKENNIEKISELPRCPEFIHKKICKFRNVCSK
jgi:hypothetical protein